MAEYPSSYQYRWHLHQLLRLDSYRALRSANERWKADNRGFFPDDTVADYVGTVPDPFDPHPLIQYYFQVLGDYQVLPENLAGLDQILRLETPEVQVIVMTMPMPATYMDFFGQIAADYQRFVAQVGEATRARGAPFLETTGLGLIPEDGWLDYSHLNTHGARIFGHWLGQHLGEAVTSREFDLSK